jgi:dihydrofolate reductase
MKAVVAMTPDRVIGRAGQIPWRFPEDLKWFKGVTYGQTVLMGRKTFESIGRPLPGRTNLVVSRTAGFAGVEMIRSLDDLDPRQYPREVFVIGGAEIYERLVPLCDELFITHIHQEFDGDTFFPSFEDRFVPAETLLERPEFEIVRYVKRKLEG